MTRNEKVNYWITSAENDWKVAGHLFEKEDDLQKMYKRIYGIES